MFQYFGWGSEVHYTAVAIIADRTGFHGSATRESPGFRIWRAPLVVELNRNAEIREKLTNHGDLVKL